MAQDYPKVSKNRYKEAREGFMKKWMRWAAATYCAGLLVLSSYFFFPSSWGRFIARLDLSIGRPELHFQAGESGLSQDFRKGMKDHYGIRVVDHGCLVEGGSILRYHQAYDRQIVDWSQRRFGCDVVSSIQTGNPYPWKPIL
jgi:hypothetical protein